MKLENPSFTILIRYGNTTTVIDSLTLKLLNFVKYNAHKTNDTNCPITVARAAPSIPHLKENKNNQSRKIFKTAPVVELIIEYFGLPSARMRWATACVKVKKGIPNAVIPSYVQYRLKLSENIDKNIFYDKM